MGRGSPKRCAWGVGGLSDELRVLPAGPTPRPPQPPDLPPEALALAVLAIGIEAGGEAHAEELAAGGLGGVVFFASALTDPEAAAGLVSRLQAAAARSPVGAPLLVGADEEGGRVARLPRGPASLPGASALGATGEAALCKEAGRATALRLAAVGANWDLAPVFDLGGTANGALNGRAFSADPEACGRLAGAFAQGLADGGAIGCAKHFPGHGGTTQDSHQALPVLSGDPALLAASLAPFGAAIAHGIPMVMTGHLLVPSIDARWPASLSPALHRLLREDLGFGGVVVTDSLGMGGCLQVAGGVGQAAVQALRAGADLLLVGHGPAEQLQAHAAVVRAVRSGELPLQRLVEAAGRVLALKRERGLERRAMPDGKAAPRIGP